MSRRGARTGIALAVAAAAALAVGAAKEKKNAEPFYRKYLVRGEPLDDRIRDQEGRVEANPKSPGLRNDFGNLLAERRFLEDARRQYEAALDLDPSHYVAAYNLGLLYESEGRVTKAISAYRKAIARKRGFPQAHFRLGRLYERRGWDTLAIEAYAKALRIDPAMRDPRSNPFAAETRLLDRASLVNYARDLAAASAPGDAVYVEAERFRRIPLDRPVSADDVSDAPAPEPIDATSAAVPATVLPAPSAPPRVERPAPALGGSTLGARPRQPTAGPRRVIAPPPPTPFPQPEPEIIEEPTPEPEPMPKEPPPPPD